VIVPLCGPWAGRRLNCIFFRRETSPKKTSHCSNHSHSASHSSDHSHSNTANGNTANGNTANISQLTATICSRTPDRDKLSSRSSFANNRSRLAFPQPYHTVRSREQAAEGSTENRCPQQRSRLQISHRRQTQCQRKHSPAADHPLFTLTATTRDDQPQTKHTQKASTDQRQTQRERAGLNEQSGLPIL